MRCHEWHIMSSSERDIKWLKVDRVVTARIGVEQREKTIITAPPIILEDM